MQDDIAAHLKKIFGTDFREFGNDPEALFSRFSSHDLTLGDLYETYKLVAASDLTMPVPDDGRRKISIPAAMQIGGNEKKKAVVQLAQVHGNEPVGLATVLYSMALSEAGLLDAKVYAALGNHRAASYYWEAWRDDPEKPAPSRSYTRTMIGDDDRVDLNRFLPVRAQQAKDNFPYFVDEMLQENNEMLHRGAKLSVLVCQPGVKLVFDPHTSRQEPYGIRTINISASQMERIEKGKGAHGGILRGVPEDIRVFPSGLLGKLGQSDPKITLKELFEAALNTPEIPVVGIECGHHETLSDCAPRAVRFYNALLYNLGISGVQPEGWQKDKGIFEKHEVDGRLPIAWLEGEITQGDTIYPVRALESVEALPTLPEQEHVKHHFVQPLQVIFKNQRGAELVTVESEIQRAEIASRIESGERAYVTCQFMESESIAHGQEVMLGVPSGSIFTAPRALDIFFPTKSAYIYGAKPGMWPVEVKDVEAAGKAKFGYGIFKKEEISLPLEPDTKRPGEQKKHPRILRAEGTNLSPPG